MQRFCILWKRSEFVKIEQIFCNFHLVKVDSNHFSITGFDPSDNFDRKTVDGRKRSLKVDVLITMYEALMEYTITHGVIFLLCGLLFS